MHTEISNFDVREITLTPWRKIEKLYKITNQINKREIKKAVNLFYLIHETRLRGSISYISLKFCIFYVNLFTHKI